MNMQNADALYRRHENEWAAFRDAVQKKELSQKRDEPVSADSFSGSTSSDQE